MKSHRPRRRIALIGLLAERNVTIPGFNATIGCALDLPLDAAIYPPSERPFTIAGKGQPVTELFGHAPLQIPGLATTA